jgi:hypothetical protein
MLIYAHDLLESVHLGRNHDLIQPEDDCGDEKKEPTLFAGSLLSGKIVDKPTTMLV